MANRPWEKPAALVPTTELKARSAFYIQAALNALPELIVIRAHIAAAQIALSHGDYQAAHQAAFAASSLLYPVQHAVTDASVQLSILKLLAADEQPITPQEKTQ